MYLHFLGYNFNVYFVFRFCGCSLCRHGCVTFLITLTNLLLVFILGIPDWVGLSLYGPSSAATLFPLSSPLTALSASGKALFKYFACLPYLTLIGIFVISAYMGVTFFN